MLSGHYVICATTFISAAAVALRPRLKLIGSPGRRVNYMIGAFGPALMAGIVHKIVIERAVIKGNQ